MNKILLSIGLSLAVAGCSFFGRRPAEVVRVGTYNIRLQCGEPGSPDYIYVSPGVRVIDYATHSDVRQDRPMYPSDHFPVSATVVL